MTLEDYRNEIPWSRAKLARQAGLSYEAVMNAENGKWITPNTAGKLLRAISEARGGEALKVSDIEGWRVKGVTKVNVITIEE